MKAVYWLLVLAAVAFAGNAVSAPIGSPVNVYPSPSALGELYWDDGILSSGWAWYSGGNYWAVQFDETQTDNQPGYIWSLGAMTYPGWPDSTFQGCYIHIFDDQGGLPDSSVGNEYLCFTSSSEFNWVDTGIEISTGVFYAAFMQYGNYPSCDSCAVDAAAGTHNWTGYQGSWGATSTYSDFMVRVYWEPWDPNVETTTWGQVKSLY